MSRRAPGAAKHRSCRLLAVIVLLATGGLVPSSGAAQEAPRDEYWRQIPVGLPTLKPAAPATGTFNLFGDTDAPGYRDVNPRDGIDDARHGVLMELAVRFAPFLVQNTSDIPVNFRVYAENRERFPLEVDRWEVTGAEPRLVSTREVNFSALGGRPCPAGEEEGAFSGAAMATTDPVLEDCKLLALMDEFTPGTSEVHAAAGDLIQEYPGFQEVLFFNFPGDGSQSWREAYAPEYEDSPDSLKAAFPHSFVHPFVVPADRPDGSTGYELVLQYWFFYPSNDSGMNHEGDWEHINVVVSPMSMVTDPLNADTVEEILAGAWTDRADDPLVIRRIDYYFHEYVQPVDFSRPNVYQSREAWEAEADTLPQLRYREREIWEVIRYRAYLDDAETRINTHPIGYIGSDNKGLNQLLEAPGGSNRDAHGTYPWPGRFSNVGPGGSTDQISTHVDHRRYFRRLEAGEVDRGPDFRRNAVLGLDRPERLEIVPDWERVVDDMRTDPELRWRWAWLVLPIRWGYPASVSPFAGILKNFNTGNVAPQGPSYNSGWNRSGATNTFHLYDPHTVASVFPLSIQDNFRNDLGFLNATVPLFTNLPPLDFISRVAAYPFRRLLQRQEPVFYPADSIPFRFTGISSGVSIQSLDQDFDVLILNPRQFDEFLSSALGYLTSAISQGATITGGEDFIDRAVGTFIQVPFYIGGRITSENMVRNVRSSFGTRIDFDAFPSYRLDADLNYWEYAGSLRYSVLTGALQPFAKVGYGWSWYRLENLRDTNGPYATANSRWFGPGSILPNVWHFGGGVEWVPWRRIGTLPGGLEWAFRAEYVRYIQDLDVDLERVPLADLELLFPTAGDVPTGSGVHRDDLLLGITLSF